MTPVTEKTIKEKMLELANKLEYKYRNLDYLTHAMFTKKIDNTAKSNYSNSSMATVGDAVLKLIISDNFYRKNKTRGEITQIKSIVESNSNFYIISNQLGLCHYAYNDQYFFDDAPQHLRLPSGEHDVYLEAVACAVFHDLGFEACRDWVEHTILPSLRL